jgi:hypothetical protein
MVLRGLEDAADLALPVAEAGEQLMLLASQFVALEQDIRLVVALRHHGSVPRGGGGPVLLVCQVGRLVRRHRWISRKGENDKILRLS